MNEKRINWERMDAFDTFITICLCICLPWKWLLLIGLWTSNRNHMCDIEDKIDNLDNKISEKNKTIEFISQPIIENNQVSFKKIDTIRSYYDERSY